MSSLSSTVSAGGVSAACAAAASGDRFGGFVVASSARSFRHYFHDLRGADSTLNPVERFVFSLMLANTKPAPSKNTFAVAPARRQSDRPARTVPTSMAAPMSRLSNETRRAASVSSPGWVARAPSSTSQPRGTVTD